MSGSEREALERNDVRRLQALLALHDLELDLLTLGQRLVAVGLDRAEVDEDVLTLVALDESVALLVREPLHGALSQHILLHYKKRTTARARAADRGLSAANVSVGLLGNASTSAAVAGRLDRVPQEHRDRHRPDAARDGRHQRRPLGRVGIDVAAQAGLGAVHADVDHARAGLDHVGRDDSGLARPRRRATSASATCRAEVGGARVADRDGRVGAAGAGGRPASRRSCSGPMTTASRALERRRRTRRAAP